MRVDVDARGTFDGRNQDVGVPPGAQHLVVKRLAVFRAENGIATAQQRTSLISLECLLMTQSGRCLHLKQSVQGYNDRAQQVMIDVRFWHLADIDADDEHVCFWG